MTDLIAHLYHLGEYRGPGARYRALRRLVLDADAQDSWQADSEPLAAAVVARMAAECAVRRPYEPSVELLANLIDRLGPAADAALWALLTGPPLTAVVQTDATARKQVIGGKSQALRRLRDRLSVQAAPSLLALARDAREPADVRDRAAVALVRLVGEAAADEVAAMALAGPLEDLFHRADRDAWQRTDLYSRGGPALVPPLLEALADPRTPYREQARRLLLALDTHARPGLAAAAHEHPNAVVRARAQDILDRLPPAPSRPGPARPEDRGLSRAETPRRIDEAGLSRADEA